jgi:hypothetical protein
MHATSSAAKRSSLWAVLGATLALGTPAACLYPDYSFNEPEPTGMGGSGGVSSTSSSTATQAGSESCTNGVDDNGDGKVDCADATCGAYACVSAVPATWTGYFTLFDGEPGKDPGCPDTFPTESYLGNATLSAPSATCPDCSCAPPQEQSCTLPDLFVSNSSCAAQQTLPSACGFPVSIVVDGTCNNLDFLQGGDNTCANPVGTTCPTGNQPCNASITVKPPTMSGGKCTPIQPMQTVVPPAWKVLGRACGQTNPGKGCNVGQVCLPEVSAPYQPGICIQKQGVNACPAAFPNQHIYYDSFTDDRKCAPCQCGPPTGASCTTSVTIYTDSACTLPVASIPAGNCKDISGNPRLYGRKTVNTKIIPGSCQPSGGQAIGMAMPVGPTTFCCK